MAGSKANRRKVITFVVIIALLALVFKLLPVKEYLGRFLDYVESLGTWGPVVLALAYIVATICMVPGVILSLGAGFIFGIAKGTVCISVGSTLGALCAFLLGRNVARGFVEERVKEYPTFAALDEGVKDRGFLLVLLTRLSPAFPFNLLNYFFGLTKVKVRDYFLASWIGMLPGTLLYVYLGSAAKSLTEIVQGNYEGSPWTVVVLVVGLLLTIVVTVMITRIARSAIKQYVPEP